MGTKRRARQLQGHRPNGGGSGSGDSCASVSSSLDEESCGSMASFDSELEPPPSTTTLLKETIKSRSSTGRSDANSISCSGDEDDTTSSPKMRKPRKQRGEGSRSSTTRSTTSRNSSASQHSTSGSSQDTTAAAMLAAERRRLQSRLPTPKASSTIQQRKREEEPPGKLKKKGSKVGLDLLSEAELKALQEDSSVYSSSSSSSSGGDNSSSKQRGSSTRPEPPGAMDKMPSQLGLDLLDSDYEDSCDAESSLHDDDEGSGNKTSHRTMEQLQREYQDNMSVVSDDLLDVMTDDDRTMDTSGYGMSVCSLDFMKELDDEPNKEHRRHRHKTTSRPGLIPHTVSTLQQRCGSHRPERAPVRQESQKTKQQRKRKIWGQILCFSVTLLIVVVIVVMIITRKSDNTDLECFDNDDNNNTTEHVNSKNCTTTVETQTQKISVSMPLDLWGILDNMLGVTVQVFVQSCSQYWTEALAANPEYDAIIQEVECRVLSQELVVRKLERHRLLRQRSTRYLQDAGGSSLRLITVLQVLVEVRVVVPEEELPLDNFNASLLQYTLSESGGRWQNILNTASDFFASLTLIAPPMESTAVTNTTGADELGEDTATAPALEFSTATPTNTTATTAPNTTANSTLAPNDQ